MEEKDAIRVFAQKTLGCGCPEEVFSLIEFQKKVPLDTYVLSGKINIGNRLLIYIAETDGKENLQELLSFLVKQGKAERDRLQFNRFRLVLAVEGDTSFEQHANALFGIIEKDDKIHLHIIRKSEIPFF